jgi:dipeptidyl aminopeptidase/acylaminoacyl peptidase
MTVTLNRFSVITLFVFLAAMLSLPALGQTPIAADSLTPRYSVANLSPDGRYLALATPRDGGDHVVVIDLENQQAQPVGYPLERGIVNNILWRGNDAIIIQVYGRYSIYPCPLSVAYLAHTKSGERPIQITFRPPASDAGVSTTTGPTWSSLSDVIDLMPEEEDFFYMAGMVNRSPTGWYTFGVSPDNIWARDLLRVDTETGVSSLAMLGTQDTAQWFADGAGNILARLDLLPSGAQTVRVPDGDRFFELTTIDGTGEYGGQILGLSHDSSALIVRSNRGPNIDLVPLDLATGTMKQPLFSGPNYTGAIFDPSSFRVIGVRYAEGLLAKANYLEPEFTIIQTTLEGALPGHSIRIITASADRQKVLFEARGPARAPALGIFDAGVPSITTVAEQYPDVAQNVHSEVRLHPYEGTDGTTSGGMLVLPPGGVAENLPTAVLDDTRTDLQFDLFAHFLSSHGFAVFRPGVRQARAFGELSGMGDLEDWVASYQQSVMGGLSNLVEEGITDPERVCIIGRGENGYAALMTAASFPNTFKCAVGVNGMYDLRRAMNDARFASTAPVNSYYYAFARNYDNFEIDDLERFSPVNYGEEIDASVLIVGDDWNGGHLAMVNALASADKEVAFVELVDNHTEPADSRFANLHTQAAAIEEFLSEQIGR